MKLHDNLAGPGITILTDKSAVLFSGYYEHELLETPSGLFGGGAVVKYSNLGSVVLKNAFLGGQISYSFTKINGGKIIPFVGLMAGTDFQFAAAWYCTQAGVRYFFKDNLAVTGRFGFGNNWFISPEIGLDFRF
ncbi:MAG: hypothetical protein PHN88_00020 [Ignavibacteria bacterium]|nr:hypothetical protein [Ignavibacteria bacterium]